MRERLAARVWFTVPALIALVITTAVIVAVAGHHPGHGRLVVARPAATASPAPSR